MPMRVTTRTGRQREPGPCSSDSMGPMIRHYWLPIFLLTLGPLCAMAAEITVDLRSRVEAFKGSGEWREVHLQQTIPVEKTAVLICDMWDKHWCRGATERVGGLVLKMAPFLESARKRG